MKKNHRPIETRAWIIYLGIALAAFAPAFLNHQVYFEGDIIDFHFPAWSFFKQGLSQGHFPLWCPYLLGGQPFAADPNSMVFYLPAYIFLLPSASLGWGIYDALHLFLTAWGLHLWLKSFGLEEASCRVGAAAYALSGFFWLEIIHPTVLAGYAWLPWWGWALDRLSQTGERRWAFGAGLFFALLFLSGHFQIFLGAVYGGGAYFFWRVMEKSGGAKKKSVNWRALGWAAAVFLWAALPLLALAVPFVEFSSLSMRAHQPWNYLHFNADLSLNPGMLFKFLFPSTAWPSGHYSLAYSDLLENAGYVGIWSLFLVFLALRFKSSRWWIGFWILGAGVALLLGLGKHTPFHEWVCEYVAGFQFIRAPYRFLFIFTLAGAFLSALGWDAMRKSPSKETAAFRIWVLVYALAAGIAALFSPGKIPAFCGLILGGAGLWAALGKQKSGRVGEWIFLIGLCVSMILGGWKSGPSRWGPSSNFDFLKNRPEMASVKQKVGLGRADLLDKIPYPIQVGGQRLYLRMPFNAVETFDLRGIQGYNPLVLLSSADTFALPLLTQDRLWALDAATFPQPGFIPEPYGGLNLYLAREPFTYVYAPARFETVESDADRLALMDQKDFNPYELSYFSAPPPKVSLRAPPARDLLSYQLTRDDPDDQIFEVSRQKGGWTVFSEVMYPGWKAWVDEGPSPLVTVNHVFRAVFVPAGNHEVRFSYEPLWWTPIRIGLALWFWSVFMLFWKPWRQWALGSGVK